MKNLRMDRWVSLAFMALLPSCTAAVGEAGDVDGAEVEEVDSIEAALETMTDRCSGEVAIPSTYNGRPESPGTVILKRDASGGTPWSNEFRVSLGGSGHIRWWCHSTTGNWFDPGTWRVKEVSLATVCDVNADGSFTNCRVKPSLKIGSSAWQGWTAERSRCGNRATRIRARLGTNRLLQIQCLGK